MFNDVSHAHGFHSTVPQGTVSKLFLFIYIIIFGTENLCDSNSILEKNVVENLHAKHQASVFHDPASNFQVWARCLFFATNTNGLMLGHPHFLAFPWFNEIRLPFSKTQTCQLFDLIVKRCKKIVLHCEKSASECLRHMASLYVFFCAYKSSWSLHGFTYQDQGLATARSLPPFFQLNMKLPGFTMAQIQVIINIQVSWTCSLQIVIE